MNGDAPSATLAYRREYRRIAAVADIAPGRARLFNSGGTRLLIFNDHGRFSAYDVTSLARSDRLEQPEVEALRSSVTARDQALPSCVDDQQWVWVCIETCADEK